MRSRAPASPRPRRPCACSRRSAPDDAVPDAVSIYAGLRRREIQPLRWADVDLSRHWLTVAKSKSEAGTGRRVPLAEALEHLLLKSADRHGLTPGARVARVSVMSGKLAERAFRPGRKQ